MLISTGCGSKRMVVQAICGHQKEIRKTGTQADSQNKSRAAREVHATAEVCQCFGRLPLGSISRRGKIERRRESRRTTWTSREQESLAAGRGLRLGRQPGVRTVGLAPVG